MRASRPCKAPSGSIAGWCTSIGTGAPRGFPLWELEFLRSKQPDETLPDAGLLCRAGGQALLYTGDIDLFQHQPMQHGLGLHLRQQRFIQRTEALMKHGLLPCS